MPLNNLPIGCIVGAAVLPKALYEKQLLRAHSFYSVFGDDYRFVTFLGSVAADKQSAWYYWVVNWLDEETQRGDYWLKSASAMEMLEFAKQKCAQIDPSLKEVLDATQPEGMGRYMLIRDLIPSPIPTGRVTLLGDAWHPMTFFRGEGGNHAIQDALDFGKVLQEDALFRRHLYFEPKDADWIQLLAEYCARTFPRAKEAVLASRESALDQVKGHLLP